MNDSSDSFSNKLRVSVTHTGKSDYPEVQPGLFSKTGLIPQIKTPSSSAKQGAVIDGSISAQSLKNHNSPFVLSPAVNLHEKAFQLETLTSKNRVGTPSSTIPPTAAVFSSAKSLSPPIHSTPLSALPSSLPPSSSSVSLKDDSEDSSKPSFHASPVVPSASSFSSSSSSMPSFASFKPFKLQLRDEHAPSSVSSTSINSSTQALAAESKAHVGKFDLKANVSAALHAPASQPPDGKFDVKTDVNAISQAPASQPPDGVGSPTASKVSADSASATQPSLLTSNFSNITTAKLNSRPDLQSAERVQSSTVTSASSVATDRKNESLDLEDEMEEEAPEATLNLNLGSLGSFGLGSSSTLTAPKSNPFGGSFQNAASTPGNSPFNLTVPSGELFWPATFSFQSGQPSQSPQPTNAVAFSGDFNAVSAAPEPTRSAFGQPAHIGAGQPAHIGAGQQVLGSVLGSFGQSRQIGSGLQGSGFGSASGSLATGNHAGGFGFGTGLGTPSTGGFANAATGGRFAGVGTTEGGFAGVASGGGGFAAAASAGGGFAGAASGTVGFSGAAGSGDGFGAFSNNQGGGAFAAFGNSSAGSGKPSQLFTQMRR